jgi:Skp family chaperone for outer membrane proteins
MKFIKFFAIAAIAGSAFAGSIAVLDSKQVITESQAYKNITQLTDTKYKAEKAKLEAQRKTYTDQMAAFTKEKLTQDQATLTAREAELGKTRDALTKAQTAFTKKVMKDQNDQMKALFEKFKSVVDTYAKTNNIDMVLNKYVVITNLKDKLDITKAIETAFTKSTTK